MGHLVIAGSRRMARASVAAAFGFGLAALGLTTGEVRSQERGATRGPPPLPSFGSPVSVHADSATPGVFDICDLRRIDVHLVGDDMTIDTTMSRDLIDGVFTRLELAFDVDGSRVTEDASVYAAVGSRFRPSVFVPRAGEAQPLDLRRSVVGFREVVRAAKAGGTDYAGIVWSSRLTPPAVGGKTLRATVPLGAIRERASSGATTPPSFRVVVETGCSEHPCSFDYDAKDAGLAITVDGSMNEWSGGPWIEDQAGELHPTMRALDIREVWCDHDASRLYVAVVFEEPGFGRIPASEGDVAVFDDLTVEIEPRGTAYMKPIRGSVPATSARGTADGIKYASAGKVLELSVPRDPKQTRLRIALWTDARRRDALDVEYLPFPRAGGR